MTSRAVGAALCCLVLVACGDQGAGSGTGRPHVLTSRAVAAVMLDHLPHDTSSRSATYVDEHSPKGLVGADLRYGAGEGDDGDLVRVTVSEQRGPKDCADDERCADLGDGVVLRWEELAPEEDPGVVLVQARRGGALISALVAGPAITGDPRELDVEPSVATMVALVQDPRLRLVADADVFAAGEALDDWDGGEVDPASLEKVANDDMSIVVGWIWAYGDDWRYLGPSPFKQVLGARAVGGQVEVTGELGPLTSGRLDALAAPRPPKWLRNGCLPGYRCDARAGLYLVWRPARGTDPGDAFVIYVRKGGETVAFHSVGNRLGDRWAAAAPQAGLSFWASDLTDPMSESRISLTTTRAKYDRATQATQRAK